MNNIPQNLSLAELERWAYIENIPGLKGMLDYHWNTVFSQGFSAGAQVGYDNGYSVGYDDGQSPDTWK
jgi:hypothetical protein